MSEVLSLVRCRLHAFGQFPAPWIMRKIRTRREELFRTKWGLISWRAAADGWRCRRPADGAEWPESWRCGFVPSTAAAQRSPARQRLPARWWTSLSVSWSAWDRPASSPASASRATLWHYRRRLLPLPVTSLVVHFHSRICWISRDSRSRGFSNDPPCLKYRKTNYYNVAPYRIGTLGSKLRGQRVKRPCTTPL